MTCAEAEPLLDRFLDRDLEPSELVAVARHTDECAHCERQLRELTAIGRSLATTVAADAAMVDLRAIWPAVDAGIAHIERGRRVHRLRTIPLAAGGLAIAASLMMAWWPAVTHRHPVDQVAGAGGGGGVPHVRVAARMPNDAQFDRFRGHGATIQREPKEGTTLIWVDYNPENPR